MELCPCGSGRPYSECCEPIIRQSRPAENAEELLRARYTAHVKLEMDFVKESTHPEQLGKYEPTTARSWAEKSVWEKLEIVDRQGGGPDDDQGEIEFIAHFSQKGKSKTHHELAQFKKEAGKWFFYDGQGVVPRQFVRDQPKVGRNDPCPCGSGRKFKKCCG